MDDIESIQLPEGAQSEDTKSESIDCEEVSTEGNIDVDFLKAEDISLITDDKTDEEKLVQSSDNLLSVGINSPKTTLLGKLKAKQRLQAFLLPKQSLIPNSPVKKIEDNQNLTKLDKATKKRKKNPIIKTKSLIEEIEEIKKSETAKILSPALFKERRNIYREKQYRHKSRSKSSEFVRKAPEKGKYPANWEELKGRHLSLDNVYELKLNTHPRNIKYQDRYDFRKQLLFELPPQTLSPLKVKTLNGPDKTIPPQYVRFTKRSPSISYSISHHKYSNEYFLSSEIYECIPKSHLEIITKFKTGNCNVKFTDDMPRKSARKWYPKQALSNITEGCELLQKSLGLSILQNYMDEEEEDEKNIDNSKHDNKGPEDFTSEVNMEKQCIDIIAETSRKEEINDVESECNNSEPVTKMREKSDMKKHKNRKHKGEKRDKRDDRNRKRKKDKEERVFKKKKVKKYKDDKKFTKEHKKEKNKKRESGKEDSKIDTDQKTKKHKENKKDITTNVSDKRESGIEIKREQEDNGKNYKLGLKEYYGWKESKKSDHLEYRKDDKKRHKNLNKERSIPSMQLYYDEFELSEERSLSAEKAEPIRKESGQKSRDSLQELNKKGSLIRESKRASRQKLETDFKKKRNTNKDKHSKTENFKAPEKLKQEPLFKMEPLKSEARLGTPDTDEYHSHWESDEDVSNAISYSPLLPRKLNTSWESDEDVACSDKHLADDRYADQSLRKSREKSLEKRSKIYLEGERSLEMPLNIINLSRKDPRKSSKPSNVPDRKLFNSESRLLFEEDSWERGEFLKICNDIEGEKLRHERKTLSEERKLLEIEKRKLAEKLEKRSFKGDIFDDFEANVKEISYKKVEKQDVYSKSPDCVRDSRDKFFKNDHIDEKKSKKRNRSIEDHRKKSEDGHRSHNDNDIKKFKCDKLEDYKNENPPNTVFIDLTENKSTTSETAASDICLSNEILEDKQEMMHTEREFNKRNVEKAEKYCKASEEPEIFLVPDVSDSLLSGCDSFLSDSKIASKSNILENEYEEFLRAVTTDVLKEDDVSTERKTAAKRKKKEIKKTKSRRRKYSTSSSSSSDSYDSDSSSSSSSSSSYSSSVSSTSSDERKAKRRKIKAKRKQLKAKEETVKIEMTHSIVKDLNDLQPYPVSSTPAVQIKKEEDFSYSEVSAPSSFGTIEKDVKVPLPVPSPSIVPPPCINLLTVKQEKIDDSISSKADSTTSPTKKVPLIPTKFITPLPRKQIIVTTATTIVLDTPKKEAPVTNKMIDRVESPLQNTENSFFFSLLNKRAVLNENVNDSDSQDFTDYFKKKTEKSSNNCEQISGLNAPILESKPTVEGNRTLTVENKVEKLCFNKVEKVDEITSAASSMDNEPSINDIDLPPDSPPRNVSSCTHSDLSPKHKIESPKRSPPKEKRKSHSESSKRSPHKSTSPRYRNVSPRRVSPARRRRSRDLSPIHRRSSRYHDDLTKSSPRRKRSSDGYDRRKPSPSPRSRRSFSFRNRRSISPRRRLSISPRNRSMSPRRSPSPRFRKSPSPRNRKPPVRRSPIGRSSSAESRRRSCSRSVSPDHKKKLIQQTLQRLAGMDDNYQAISKSPINSPVDGFKRSVADSTISDDQLLQQNSTESIESPYTTTTIKSIHSPLSPKRPPLDVRISQVLGLGKDSPKPVTTTYTQATYAQSYTYDQYSEHYEHYTQYDQDAMVRDDFVQPSPPPSKSQSHVGSSKVVQIGNMLQVVPAEDILPQEIPRPLPSQKIVQVGNMLQIVPSPTTHVPQDIMVPSSTNIPLQILQPALNISQPPLLPSTDHTASTTTQEKVSPEDIMLQKIAERRAERAKRHEERERKRNEKEKRRKEKEKKKQLRFKLKTENMIKKALRIETEALAMGENLDDEENGTDIIPSCWPSINITSNTPMKQVGKGILIRHGVSAVTMDEDIGNKKLKCVKFADGIAPGEGTSPSGGEELSSPPPPKEKRFKKMKKKKLQKKKKIKVKIIRKSSIESPDDEELDSLPPPSPPPGSPPSHVFPARIKTHTINNIHPTYATGVPLMTVSNYPPQFRANIPITVPPPPVHNIPHGTLHGPSPPRLPSQIVSQHGSSLHGPISHGVSSGLPLGMPGHPHTSLHHPTGLR